MREWNFSETEKLLPTASELLMIGFCQELSEEMDFQIFISLLVKMTHMSSIPGKNN